MQSKEKYAIGMRCISSNVVFTLHPCTLSNNVARIFITAKGNKNTLQNVLKGVSVKV